MSTVESEQAAPRTPWAQRRLPTLALIPVAGLVWWVCGFLPRLLDGLGHELGLGTRALPLFAGKVDVLVLGAGLGGVLGGLTARLGGGGRAFRAAASATGVAMVLFITLLQSRSAVSIGVDGRITNGLTIVVVLVTVVGLGLGLLGLTGRVGLGFALAAAAGATPMWFMRVLNAMGVGDGLQLQNAQDASNWLGAAVLAGALVVVGVQPIARTAAWPGVGLLAWIIGPTITAASYMDVFLRPGMGLPDMWGDHLSATMDVWQMAVSPGARPLAPWVVAIVVAAAVSVWLARRTPDVAAHPSQ